jgi:DnaJ-class molecular chaperone
MAIYRSHPSHECLPEGVDPPPATPIAPPGENECSDCRGLGAITCPACDGTGMWTEASEFAGHYQREAARAIGHCAWCDDWGEVRCQRCEGIGCTL